MSSHTPQPASRAAHARSYSRHDRPQPISLRLDANEGPPPPAALLQIISDIAAETTLTNTYPDLRGLEAELARRHGLRAQAVLVTAGADDALGRTAQSFLEPGRRALLTRPTFEMIERYIAHAGAEAVPVPWLGGAYPIETVLACAREAGPAVIYVVSPNNPTGGVCSTEHLRAIAAERPDALLVVDQAYAEFGGEDLTSAALALPNAVVTRTFSKAWGLAGLRVGYVLGPAPILDVLRAMGQPYAVSSLSAAIARRWMQEGESLVHDFVRRVRVERERLVPLLQTLGGEPIESHANLVLCRFNNSASIASRLADAGIAVREYPTHPILKDYLRIGLPGDPQSFETLTAALRKAIHP